MQSRGPVHEAFAQPGDLKIDAGALIPKQPPAPIQEAPPESRPDNDNMQWIPGYWAWDADRQDYNWTSGVYREPPPGRRFVPGHWVQDGTSFRWISGFWTADNQQEMAYVPAPPAPLETAPTTTQPDPNTVFVPGYWTYASGRYAWRTGYWAAYRPGRIWIAPRYVWTPSGYLFVDGYWDYPLENRGVLFASVDVPSSRFTLSELRLSADFVVSIGAVTDSLFVAPGAFYYGDYYGPAYVRLGFHPWWDHGYDPMWSYYRWHHRNDVAWAVEHAARLRRPSRGPSRAAAANLRGPAPRRRQHRRRERRGGRAAQDGGRPHCGRRPLRAEQPHRACSAREHRADARGRPGAVDDRGARRRSQRGGCGQHQAAAAGDSRSRGSAAGRGDDDGDAVRNADRTDASVADHADAAASAGRDHNDAAVQAGAAANGRRHHAGPAFAVDESERADRCRRLRVRPAPTRRDHSDAAIVRRPPKGIVPTACADAARQGRSADAADRSQVRDHQPRDLRRGRRARRTARRRCRDSAPNALPRVTPADSRRRAEIRSSP